MFRRNATARVSLGRPSLHARRALAGLLLGAVALSACATGSKPSVWIENRWSEQAVVFVTDNSDSPAAWYVVPPKTAVRARPGHTTTSNTFRGRAPARTR